MKSLVAALVVCMLAGTHSANVPMSDCKFARGTAYPIARNASGTPQGTCGFGKVAHLMPTWFSAGYLSAPDDETYNGYPFLTPTPLSITTGGVGLSCGECFEVTGPTGTIVVMSADVCDKGCCDNCQGSLGGPLGGPDVQAFDIEKATWTTVSGQTGGNVVLSYRKVACDVQGKTVSFFFNAATEGTPQPTYFRLRVFNFVVGVKTVEVKGSASGGTGGQWTALKRGWEGYFNWTSSGDIGAPFQVRVTSILGDTITFPQSVAQTDLQPLKVFDSGLQFALPPAGYGGSSSGVCTWPGPPAEIYTDQLNGLEVGGLIWRLWGGPTPDYAYSTNCVGGTGKCISFGFMESWTPYQIGYQTAFPTSMFEGVSFYVRCSGEVAYDKLLVMWKGPSGSGTQTSDTINLGPLTTTWKLVNLTMGNFTGIPPTINVIEWQNGMNSASPVQIYLDEIVLWGGQPSSVVEPTTVGGSGSASSGSTNSNTNPSTISNAHLSHPLVSVMFVLMCASFVFGM